MHLQILGDVITKLTGTHGTVNLGHCQAVDLQAVLDVNSSNTIAVRGSSSAAATASKDNCDKVIGYSPGIGDVPCRLHLPPGANNKYVAYKVYSGGTVATATSSRDRLMATRLG